MYIVRYRLEFSDSAHPQQRELVWDSTTSDQSGWSMLRCQNKRLWRKNQNLNQDGHHGHFCLSVGFVMRLQLMSGTMVQSHVTLAGE